MRAANRTQKTALYTMWYEFKKELENQLGHSLLNWDWLEVKPKDPLPWNDSHMKAALLAVARVRLPNNTHVNAQVKVSQKVLRRAALYRTSSCHFPPLDNFLH